VNLSASKAVGIAVAVVAASIAGCGYTTRSQYPSDVRSVAVPIWTVGKNVYRRQLEFRLTEAIQKRIVLDTPYKLAPESEADTLLKGTITRIEQRVLSSNPDTGRPRELEVSIAVSFTWSDLRSGKVRREEPFFQVSKTYIPREPFDEDFFWGSEDVIDEMARRIVECLEADW